MRFTQLFAPAFVMSALCFVAATVNGQEIARVPGHIVVAKVIGSVAATNLGDDSKVELQNNMVISQHYVVTTAADSSVILIFSNGATLNVGADSTLSIDTFLQDPFSESVAASALKEEPTTSETKLNLSRGELVGNVKHLKIGQGSAFTINTPVGGAGIRGTTFRIVFRTDASGRASYALSTSEGKVFFQAAMAGAGVNVSTGTEVSVQVEVHVDATTGKVTVTAPPEVSAPQAIPAATKEAIAASARQIVEASAAVIILSTPEAATKKASSSDTPADKAPTDKSGDEKSTSTPDTTTTPTVPATAPATPSTPATPQTTPIVTPGPSSIVVSPSSPVQ
jgi:hypothetical protein